MTFFIDIQYLHYMTVNLLYVPDELEPRSQQNEALSIKYLYIAEKSYVL